MMFYGMIAYTQWVYYILVLGVCCTLTFVITSYWNHKRMYKRPFSKSKAQELKEKEDKMGMSKTPSYLDKVTGVYNMHFFYKEVEQRTKKDVTTPAYLILIDVSKFRYINEIYGFKVANKVLNLIGSSLKYEFKEALIARSMGNVFVLYDETMQTKEELQKRLLLFSRFIEQRAKQICQAPVILYSGVGRYPNEDANIHILYEKAFHALEGAKKTKTKRIGFYQEDVYFKMHEEQVLQMELERALRQGEFFLAYQPIVELQEKRVVAMEALIRWEHPQKGVLLPAAFLDKALQYGLMEKIGAWVIKQALADLAIINKTNPNFVISINVSPEELHNPIFPYFLEKEMRETHVFPQNVYLEITEQSVLLDKVETLQTIDELRKMGVKLALDDFGTGFSNFSQLRQYPVEAFKLDRSFLLDASEEKGYSIIHSLVRLADDLNISVLSEGVEEQCQCEKLQEIGCNYAQGYYFGRPKRIEDFLKEHV